MNWSRCIRCGSNRVIEVRSVRIAFGSIIVGAMHYFIALLIRQVEQETVLDEIYIAIAIILILFGLWWRRKSAKLFCRDCLIKWKPSKNE